MRLSEAIRLGSMLKPQGEGNDSVRSGHGSTCALGAAADAIGVLSDSDMDTYTKLRRRWPFMFSARTPCPTCPACQKHSDDVGSIAWHLNDQHHWTREQIADWVATIEPEEQCNAVETSSVPDAVDVLVESL